MNAQTADYIDTEIVAENAPLGVQLWPTTAPKFAPNFTLATVETVRDTNGTWVRWTYENGATRVFRLGERVTARIAR